MIEQYIPFYLSVTVVWFICVTLHVMHCCKWNVMFIQMASGSIFDAAFKASILWPFNGLFNILFLIVCIFGDNNPPPVLNKQEDHEREE